MMEVFLIMSKIFVRINFKNKPRIAFVYPIKQSAYGSGLNNSGMYERIMDETNSDHDLAESVLSWAELASLGETFEDDALLAEIVDM